MRSRKKMAVWCYKMPLKASMVLRQFLVNSVVMCPDGQTLLSGSSDSTIKKWDVKTGTLLATIKCGLPHAVCQCFKGTEAGRVFNTVAHRGMFSDPYFNSERISASPACILGSHLEAVQQISVRNVARTPQSCPWSS
eukprot:gene21436-biopygen7363